jgi:hypothetical protein
MNDHSIVTDSDLLIRGQTYFHELFGKSFAEVDVDGRPAMGKRQTVDVDVLFICLSHICEKHVCRSQERQWTSAGRPAECSV